MAKNKLTTGQKVFIGVFGFGITVYLLYLGGRVIVIKRITDLIVNDTIRSEVKRIAKSMKPQDLVDLFNFFETLRLQVDKENVQPELLERIKVISKKYNYDFTNFVLNGKPKEEK